MAKEKRPRLSVCLDSAAPKGGTQFFCCPFFLPFPSLLSARDVTQEHADCTIVQAKCGEGPASVYCTPQCMIVRPTAERKGKRWSGCNCIFWESGAEEAQRRKNGAKNRQGRRRRRRRRRRSPFLRDKLVTESSPFPPPSLPPSPPLWPNANAGRGKGRKEIAAPKKKHD